MISDFLVFLVAEWGVSMVSEFNEKLAIPRRFTVTCFNDLSSAVRWPIHMKYVNTSFFLRFFQQSITFIHCLGLKWYLVVRLPFNMKYVNTCFLHFFPAEHHIYPLFRS